MTIKSKSLAFNVKAKGDDTGTFTAYGNTFGKVDHAGDMTMKGAFTKCIQGWAAKAKMPRLLSQHGHTANPIGIITSMKEDEHGLLFEGKFCLEAGTAGAEAYALVKMGALDSFSIGYNTLKEKMVNGVNELHELDVKEISLVTFACNEDSLIQTVKSAVDAGSEITPRMIQKALQESGLSKRQAEAAVNAIKSTGEIEVAIKSGIEQFKATAKNHEITVNGVKSGDMSLGEYSSLIANAVNGSIETDDRWCYVESIYMGYVIVCVYEEIDDKYEQYYARVPYTVGDDNNVMVGSPIKVTRLVRWMTEAELATFEGTKTDNEVEVEIATKEDDTIEAEEAIVISDEVKEAEAEEAPAIEAEVETKVKSLSEELENETFNWF